MNPYKLFNIALTTLVIVFIILSGSAKADPARRGSCVAAQKVITSEPVTIVAKATKSDKVPAPKPKKIEKPIIVTMVTLYVGAGPGQTIPTAKTDVNLATQRQSGLVDAHVVPKYRNVVGETTQEANAKFAAIDE